MDNYAIADQLSMLAKLMDIHGENAFKAKSYASAAFAIEKLPEELSSLPKEKIAKIRGIGESVGKKVTELLETGEIETLKNLVADTPEGVLQMMNIKGLGPKKIFSLWKELGIDTIDELRAACQENRLAAKKGFGAKTQENILEAIRFQQQNTNKYLYAQVEPFAEILQKKLAKEFKGEKLEPTGAYRRQMEVVDELEWVTTISKEGLKKFFKGEETDITAEGPDYLELNAQDTLTLRFHLADTNDFGARLFTTTGSEAFLTAFKSATGWKEGEATTEKEVFKKTGIPFIPPFLREKETIIEKAKRASYEDVLQVSDIKGLIHAHSNWSDGAHTLEQMSEELIRLGFEYLVISDHSKAAFYANGLNEEKIKEQHTYIDTLNKKYAPFRIFKSIECDILSDGSMDFEDSVLSTFDLVIASIHSNLTMNEQKAMFRLMGAIENPHVTILGHMTGRLLTRRKGYPVDHKTIIDACANNQVVIEINANPNRLDMDWRWIDYALDKGVMLSVDPDAHDLQEFHNIKYGVMMAQKGGITRDQNLSSFSLKEFEKFLSDRKKKK